MVYTTFCMSRMLRHEVWRDTQSIEKYIGTVDFHADIFVTGTSHRLCISFSNDQLLNALAVCFEDFE